MKKPLSDTSPAAEKALIALIRSKSVAERLSQVFSMSSLALRLSKRAIARRNPGLTKKEIDLLFVKYHYGEDMYKKVKQYLSKYPDEKK